MKVYKWQSLAFNKEINLLLSKIGGDTINFLEFRLLAQQAHLVFLNF